jgi:hypothetical protein
MSCFAYSMTLLRKPLQRSGFLRVLFWPLLGNVMKRVARLLFMTFLGRCHRHLNLTKQRHNLLRADPDWPNL